MMAVNDVEIWRQIPPEEKFELLSRAHASGLFTAIIMVVIGSTIAISLQMNWILWSSLLISPLVFQFAAGKAWRDLRPRIMLEYLAARSASRRYAFANRSQDLTLSLIFKGTLEQQFEEENLQEALEAMISQTKDAEVWVALFSDVLIMIAERPGGASLQFAHLLDDKLKVSSNAKEKKSDYTNDKEVYLTYKDRATATDKQFKLTSRFPAALAVFEKRLLTLKEEAARKAETKIAEFLPADTDGGGGGEVWGAEE